ncbi:hypothetical protein MLD38_001990 [Melastoma candidum]|uniref:Uncharacterized protein n=1 Tax=Melastoma candidum TaxID=119954 RepID=A0ACB9SGA5_9MYRT|nr:hypothetical protein MLD38_001990 [Melastoma candidum]
MSESTLGKAISCRAAVCRKAGEPLTIEEVRVEPPQEWEVRVKILCTSICHTDLTWWKMQVPGPWKPRILGHEAVGVVESVGTKVEGFKAGDRVVPVFQSNCETCTGCRSLKGNNCSLFAELGLGTNFDVAGRDGTSRFRGGVDGEEVLYHFLRVSSFCEYTVLDVAHVVRIGDDIPIDKACLLSCGVSTGIGGAWKVAEVEKGSTVAIFGLGVVGLAVAEGARSRGASKIIGVDLNPDKFEMGKKFGITDFVNPKACGEKSVSEVIKEMTGGGADYCFECVGLTSVVSEAFNSSREGWGKTVILGVEQQTAPLTFNPYEILKGRTVVGSFFGGLRPKTDIPGLLQKHADKELNLEGFVTQEVGFEDINEAFKLLVQGKSLRCLVWMDRE